VRRSSRQLANVECQTEKLIEIASLINAASTRFYYYNALYSRRSKLDKFFIMLFIDHSIAFALRFLLSREPEDRRMTIRFRQNVTSATSTGHTENIRL